MYRIASHICNPAKFRKASKLAVQLLEAGSVSNEIADPFFSILEAAMSPPSRATDSALRTGYSALFSAVLERVENFSVSQQSTGRGLAPVGATGQRALHRLLFRVLKGYGTGEADH